MKWVRETTWFVILVLSVFVVCNYLGLLESASDAVLIVMAILVVHLFWTLQIARAYLHLTSQLFGHEIARRTGMDATGVQSAMRHAYRRSRPTNVAHTIGHALLFGTFPAALRDSVIESASKIKEAQ